MHSFTERGQTVADSLVLVSPYLCSARRLQGFTLSETRGQPLVKCGGDVNFTDVPALL